MRSQNITRSKEKNTTRSRHIVSLFVILCQFIANYSSTSRRSPRSLLLLLPSPRLLRLLLGLQRLHQSTCTLTVVVMFFNLARRLPVQFLSVKPVAIVNAGNPPIITLSSTAIARHRSWSVGRPSDAAAAVFAGSILVRVLQDVTIVINTDALIVDVRKVGLRELVASSNSCRLSSGLRGSPTVSADVTVCGAWRHGRRVDAVVDVRCWPHVVRITMSPLLTVVRETRDNTDLRDETRQTPTISSKADVPRTVRRRLKFGKSVGGMNLAEDAPVGGALPLKTSKTYNILTRGLREVLTTRVKRMHAASALQGRAWWHCVGLIITLHTAGSVCNLSYSLFHWCLPVSTSHVTHVTTIRLVYRRRRWDQLDTRAYSIRTSLFHIACSF